MTTMLIEVHTTTKPAVPHRALIATCLLLVLASGLAGRLAWRRSAATLGLRVAPAGWDISFRLPRSFGPGERTDSGELSVLGFSGAAPDGAPALIRVRRFPVAAGVGPDAVAELVAANEWADAGFKTVAQGRSFSDADAPFRQLAKLGPHQAVEIVNPQLATIVRATKLRIGYALAVTLQVGASRDSRTNIMNPRTGGVRGGVIDPHLYRLFDLSCRSVEYERTATP